MRNGYICVPSCGIRFPFKNEVSSFCFLYSDEIDPHLEKGQAGLSGDFRDAAIRVEADIKSIASRQFKRRDAYRQPQKYRIVIVAGRAI